MSTSSPVPSSQVRFPDVTVELSAQDWSDRHAGIVLRAKTRTALANAGHESDSPEYLAATRDLQRDSMRDDLLRATREWVNVDITGPPIETTRRDLDDSPLVGTSAPSDVISGPADEIQAGGDSERYLLIMGIWLIGLLSGCVAVLNDIQRQVHSDVAHESPPAWSFVVAPLFMIAGSMLVAEFGGADRSRPGIDWVHKVYMLILTVLTLIGLIAMDQAIGSSP